MKNTLFTYTNLRSFFYWEVYLCYNFNNFLCLGSSFLHFFCVWWLKHYFPWYFMSCCEEILRLISDNNKSCCLSIIRLCWKVHLWIHSKDLNRILIVCRHCCYWSIKRFCLIKTDWYYADIGSYFTKIDSHECAEDWCLSCYDDAENDTMQVCLQF